VAGVPRIPRRAIRLVLGIAHQSEFGHIGSPERDESGGSEPTNDGAVMVRHMLSLFERETTLMVGLSRCRTAQVFEQQRYARVGSVEGGRTRLLSRLLKSVPR
jgi:hypothetical protein